jgi:hypothetical protein
MLRCPRVSAGLEARRPPCLHNDRGPLILRGAQERAPQDDGERTVPPKERRISSGSCPPAPAA